MKQKRIIAVLLSLAVMFIFTSSAFADVNFGNDDGSGFKPGTDDNGWAIQTDSGGNVWDGYGYDLEGLRITIYDAEDETKVFNTLDITGEPTIAAVSGMCYFADATELIPKTTWLSSAYVGNTYSALDSTSIAKYRQTVSSRVKSSGYHAEYVESLSSIDIISESNTSNYEANEGEYAEVKEAAETKSRKKKDKSDFSEISDKSVKEIERSFIPFDTLLSRVQQHMAENYAVELYEADKKDMMKRLIKQYMKDNNYYVPNMTLGEVADKLYIEMAEYSILTPWLLRKDIEEININGWDDVEIIPAKGARFKAEHFKDAGHLVDVLKRLLHHNHITWDSSKPIATGFLGSNIRVTAGYTDICDNARGACASIRIVNPSKITREQFIESAMVSEEEYDFLVTCFIHGVSQCYAGETGSGKTTIMADIMSNYPNNKRLITLEKSVREFDLVKRDENGNVINDVLHLVTKETDDPARDVTLAKLLTMCLTMHPNSICVAEMKNEEAWQAQEAARTGHTVLTTTHASSTHQIYTRLATLCLQAHSLPLDTILSLVTEAFPIGIYLKQLDDGSRHIMEIAECIQGEKGKYETRTLYRYDIIDEVRNPDGTARIIGKHVKVNPPTENFMKRLRDNGVPKDKLEIYGRV